MAAAAAATRPPEFGRVVVGASVGGVMQVVELGDPGEAAFQHFGKGHLGDSLDVFGGQAPAQAVHGFAPGPEMIVARSSPLGQAGEAALERVAVEIAETRHRDAAPFIQGGVARVGPDLHRDHPSVRDPDRHVVLPAVGRQGRVEKELVHGGGSDGVWAP